MNPIAARTALRKGNVKRAAVLIALAICSLFFVLFQGGKLAFMLFIFVMVLGTYLYLGRWSGIAHVKAVRILSNTGHGNQISAGNPLKVKVDVDIPGFYPIPYVLFEEQIQSSKGRAIPISSTFIPDYRRRGEVTYETAPLERGIYTLQEMIFATEDIFGLFEHRGTVKKQQHIRVYPRMTDIPDWVYYKQLSKGAHAHTATSRANRETTQINGVREYVYGDKLSRIHWNATARTGAWKSKEYEREAMPRLVFILDRRKQVYTDQATVFELAVSAVASLIRYGSRQQMLMGLVSGGKQATVFTAKRGELHADAMIDHLVEAEPDSSYSPMQLAEGFASSLGRGAMIVLLSPVQDQSIMDTLAWAARNHMSACHFLPVRSGEEDQARQWSAMLRARGFVSYPFAQLKELPQLLGGRHI